MTNYKIHLQVKASQDFTYTQDGTFYKVVEVTANNTKEAWIKAQEQSGLVIVTKIEEYTEDDRSKVEKALTDRPQTAAQISALTGLPKLDVVGYLLESSLHDGVAHEIYSGAHVNKDLYQKRSYR